MMRHFGYLLIFHEMFVLQWKQFIYFIKKKNPICQSWTEKMTNSLVRDKELTSYHTGQSFIKLIRMTRKLKNAKVPLQVPQSTMVLSRGDVQTQQLQSWYLQDHTIC